MFDLHIHTTATPHHSSWEPEQLVVAARDVGLRVIAVTDHNTTASVTATQIAGQRIGLQVLAGVEIDSSFPATEPSPIPVKLWHTLIYGVAPMNAELMALCASVYQRNLADARRLREELPARGFSLPDFGNLGRPPNVADVGTALAELNALERRAGEDAESAGMRYILTEVNRGYQPVGVDEVIAVAHRNGGVAILAHPGRSKGLYAIPASEADIAAMVATGLDGIEVYYPTHTGQLRVQLQAYADQYGLLVTGGSDSHHPHQPLAAWPYTTIEPLLDRLGMLQ